MMTLLRTASPGTPSRRLLLLLLLLGLAAAPAWRAEADDKTKDRPLPPALDKPAPESVEDLKAIQEQLKKVLEKVVPCTVGLQVGGAQGSGVIVSEDGYVLTAAHVSGSAKRSVEIYLADGRKVKGETLGASRLPGGTDSGLIKITDEGKWPFAEMGKSAELKKGQWCICVGHPGGYNPKRSPPVRLGRVLNATSTVIRTDCTLVGGDSGGPLFDMNGLVIGIHSRIDSQVIDNLHVPVDTYRDNWDRLVKGEVWGSVRVAYLGAERDPEADNCRISGVKPDSPAAKAGLKAGDVVTKFDGQKIATFDDLKNQILKKKPGDEVTLEVVRAKETITLKAVLGRSPG